jgi:flagellum-specific peptidoglycan hydrolase FlgJ
MLNQKNENRDYRVGSRQYERVRQDYVQLIKGVPKSEQHRQNLSRSKLGVKKPPMTAAHRENLRHSITGIVKSTQHRENLAKAKSIPVIQYDLQENFIKEWESAKQAGNELKIDASDICSCRRGKRKSVGGFVWKYK